MLIFTFYQTEHGLDTRFLFEETQGHGNDPEHWDYATGNSGDMHEDDDTCYLGIRSNAQCCLPQ